MANDRPGILAIWNDVAPGRDADFNNWFQGEHLEERRVISISIWLNTQTS